MTAESESEVSQQERVARVADSLNSITVAIAVVCAKDKTAREAVQQIHYRARRGVRNHALVEGYDVQ